MEKLNFLDIGTSDFDYSIPKNNECGIYVEPIKMYLNNIPNYPNTIKLQLGITTKNQVSKIYYLDPNFINEKQLPKYLKGCNCIDKIHPTILNECRKKNINHLDGLITEQVECITFTNLIDRYKIKIIDFLKIDTEGSDCYILPEIINLTSKNILYIHQIMFESNSLTPSKIINDTYDTLEKNGWKLFKKFKGSNTLCTKIN